MLMKKIFLLLGICGLTLLVSCWNNDVWSEDIASTDFIFPEIENAIPNDDEVEISSDDMIQEIDKTKNAL